MFCFLAVGNVRCEIWKGNGGGKDGGWGKEREIKLEGEVEFVYVLLRGERNKRENNETKKLKEVR